MASMVLLRAGDDRLPPAVCIHPVSGRADAYRQFANLLDWPGSVLGVNAPEPPAEGYRFADLASRYCDDLQLERPAVLLGWSIGGVIAAELCHTIIARGGTVSFVGILDSRVPQPEMRKRPTDRDGLARAFLNYAMLARDLDPVAPTQATDATTLLATLRQIGAADGITDEAELERRLAMFMGLVRAFFQHELRPVPVKLHVFEAIDAHPSHPKPPTLGWDEMAPGIERHPIGGTHFSLLAPRHVEALAQTIARCLPR